MNSNRKAIVYDFDNTLTKTDTIKFVILSFLIRRPMKIGDAIKQYCLFKHGRVPAEEAKHTIIGMLISGYSSQWVTRCMGIYIRLVHMVKNTTIWNKMIDYKKNGTIVLIATASPQFAVEAVMTEYLIPVIGTTYVKKDDLYTGQTVLPIPFKHEKAVKVKQYLDSCGIETLQYAFSDSLDDMPLLSLAQKGYLVQHCGRYVVEVKLI